ncbi:hypothetical protein FXO38_22556 [Capsicum annuum]|nr:hypothetical protein FXO38_22556 [Capsicum annuum]
MVALKKSMKPCFPHKAYLYGSGNPIRVHCITSFLISQNQLTVRVGKSRTLIGQWISGLLIWVWILHFDLAMVDNTPTKMVTRSISRSDPDARTVPTFDLEISQSEEEDALPSEEVRGIGHKRKVRDDVSTPNNDDDDLVKEKQYYRIHGMPLAMQVWLYECCSTVDPKIIVKHGSRILRLLNWETTDRRPHFEAFIEGMLADIDNPVTMTL